MESVLREQIVGVDQMEEEGDEPIGNVRRDDGEPKVGNDAWEEVWHRLDAVSR